VAIPTVARHLLSVRETVWRDAESRCVRSAHHSMTMNTTAGGTNMSNTPMMSRVGWPNLFSVISSTTIGWTTAMLAWKAIKMASGISKRIFHTPLARFAT
jgi:hypothetical protein